MRSPALRRCGAVIAATASSLAEPIAARSDIEYQCGIDRDPTSGREAGAARADRWLWAVRVFKTRSVAAKACRSGRVRVGGAEVKPSRLLKTGDVVSVRKPTIHLQLRVVAPLEKRVGAKALADYVEDITPEEERRAAAEAAAARRAARAEAVDLGSGRPSKRQRRKLEQFLDEVARGTTGDG